MIARALTCLMLGLICSYSAAGDSLRLVTGDDHAPFTGKDLPDGGMLTKVVHAVLALSNVDSTLDWQPWNRGNLKTLRGEYDATFPYVPTPEREQEYLYSAPLLVVEDYIFSRSEDPLDTLDPEMLEGRSVCIPLGWPPPEPIQTLLDRGVLDRHSPIGIKECARLVMIGRDDFFVADRRLGETALQLIGATSEQLSRSHEMISSSSLHLVVPRDHARGPSIITLFDEGLARLRASGGYQLVIEGYIKDRALQASN